MERAERMGFSSRIVLRFFVSDQYSIADVALYAYTHCADEGGFELGRFPNVSRWIKAVEGTPGFVRLG